MKRYIRQVVIACLGVLVLAVMIPLYYQFNWLSDWRSYHYIHLTSALILSVVTVRLLLHTRRQADFDTLYPTLTRLPCCAIILADDNSLLYANKASRERLNIQKRGLQYRYPRDNALLPLLNYCHGLNFSAGFQFHRYAFRNGGTRAMAFVMSGQVVTIHGQRARLLFLTPEFSPGAVPVSPPHVLQSVLNSLAEMVHFTDRYGELLGSNSAFDSFWLGRVDEGLNVDIDASWGRSNQLRWTTAPDGTSRILETRCTALRNQNGEELGQLYISHDVTDWHAMQESLRVEIERRELIEQTLAQRTNLLDTLFAASQDPIGLYNEHGIFVGCNDAYIRWMSDDGEDLRGKRVMDVLDEESWRIQRDKDQRVMGGGETIKEEEYVILHDGTQLWYEVMRSPYLDPLSGSHGVLVMARDVTERKQTEQQLADAIMELQELSFVDSLTKIANRRSFDEKLSLFWHNHIREAKPLSLVFCDIDEFKAFNDNYGHQQGDHALQQVADVFKQVVKRETDVVARFGGEEFAILLTNTDSVGANVVAESIHSALRQQRIHHAFSSVGNCLSVSLGVVTLIPQLGQDYGDLVSLADKALYMAKDSGKNCTVTLEDNVTEVVMK